MSERHEKNICADKQENGLSRQREAQRTQETACNPAISEHGMSGYGGERLDSSLVCCPLG